LSQNDGISLCTRSRLRTVPPPTAVMVPTIVAAHVRIVPIRELVDWCKELMKISQCSENKDLHIGIFTAKKGNRVKTKICILEYSPPRKSRPCAAAVKVPVIAKQTVPK
jgi:hypothetical protein